jgi:hypothetical protein
MHSEDSAGFGQAQPASRYPTAPPSLILSTGAPRHSVGPVVLPSTAFSIESRCPRVAQVAYLPVPAEAADRARPDVKRPSASLRGLGPCLCAITGVGETIFISCAYFQISKLKSISSSIIKLTQKSRNLMVTRHPTRPAAKTLRVSLESRGSINTAVISCSMA